MHPIILLEKTPVEVLMGSPAALPIKPMRGLELARFGNQIILVNHRSSPVNIGGIKARGQTPQLAEAIGMLSGHSAICLTM